MRALHATAFAATWLLTLPLAAQPATRPLTTDERLAREIFKELIETDTTHSTGDTTRAAEALGARFRAAGFPAGDVVVAGPERRGNLVVRLRGSGKRRPLLVLAHLDVVEARREDWTVDPFKLLEMDGYFYGRGTTDIKDGAAILATNLLRLKREGVVPDRDLILALTADEEGGDHDGVDWLLKNRRELVEAELCLNTDGGDFQEKNGKPVLCAIQASEKLYVDFRLEVKSPGGHSSLPVKDNAITHLADGLGRLARFEFPVTLNEVTRAYFERKASEASGEAAADLRGVLAPVPDPAAVSRLSASPYFNALMRTTCVATRLDAGHANNALPQTARANVNCRLLPGASSEEVRATLVRVFADERIDVSFVRPAPAVNPASPLRADVTAAVTKAAGAVWPGVPVVPVMETGGTDGFLLRQGGIPTYGSSGVFIDMDDVRAHGKDERVGVRAFYEGLEFWYRLLTALARSAA